MDASARRSRPRFSIVPGERAPAVGMADELKIARQRMRHLAPWNVKPVPMMHSAGSKASEPAAAARSERGRQIALKVLAIHMCQAAAKGDLR